MGRKASHSVEPQEDSFNESSWLPNSFPIVAIIEGGKFGKITTLLLSLLERDYLSHAGIRHYMPYRDISQEYG